MLHLEELLEFHLKVASLNPAVNIVHCPHLLLSILLLTTHHLHRWFLLPTCNLIHRPTQCLYHLLLILIRHIRHLFIMLKLELAHQPKTTNHSLLKRRMIYWTRLRSIVLTLVWLRLELINQWETNLSLLKQRMIYWTRQRSTAPK